jgi:hypothetical protein
LRALYELAGNEAEPVPYRSPSEIPSRNLFDNQDSLVLPDKLKLKGDRFSFIYENQGVWRVETRIDSEDPPVYSDAPVQGNTILVFKVCSSLSHFLTTFCLQELAFGSRNLFVPSHESRADRPIPAQDLLLAELKPLWLNGLYAYGRPIHSFYLCDERILVMDSGDHPWLAFYDDSAHELLNPQYETWNIHGE